MSLIDNIVWTAVRFRPGPPGHFSVPMVRKKILLYQIDGGKEEIKYLITQNKDCKS